MVWGVTSVRTRPKGQVGVVVRGGEGDVGTTHTDVTLGRPCAISNYNYKQYRRASHLSLQASLSGHKPVPRCRTLSSSLSLFSKRKTEQQSFTPFSLYSVCVCARARVCACACMHACVYGSHFCSGHILALGNTLAPGCTMALDHTLALGHALPLGHALALSHALALVTLLLRVKL